MRLLARIFGWKAPKHLLMLRQFQRDMVHGIADELFGSWEGVPTIQFLAEGDLIVALSTIHTIDPEIMRLRRMTLGTGRFGPPFPETFGSAEVPLLRYRLRGVSLADFRL